MKKIQIASVCLLFFLLFVSSGSEAWAGNTVRVFLMAGQSNMEGNNTGIPGLEKLICHANSGFTLEGMTCGATDVETSQLIELFLDIEQPLDDYYYAQSLDPNHPVVAKLGSFLCTAGKLALPGEDCGSLNFDLTDRLFATISSWHYNAGTQQFGYGYDAFREMSAAMGISEIQADGNLTADLLAERSDVTVLQFQGRLAADGTLSLSERSGLLSPGFGAKNNMYGPELMFGHYMGDLLDEDALLLKVVQGGTDLRVDWKTPCSSANTGNNFTAEELAQDSLYDALVAKAIEIQDADTLAQYFPQYAGKTAQIVGFVWFQGWNDGGNPVNEANYETNLTCLLSDLRIDLIQPNLPVVIAQTHRGEPGDPVQLAQAQVAAAFDRAELAITDDLSGYFHFDSAAHLVIGQRMAAKMISLLGLTNAAPVANDQSFRMRAAELLALPITLAATDVDRDALDYTIVSGPFHGSLSGTPPRLEYVPDSIFRGQDTFTYKAGDGRAESNIAGVTIDVIQEPCTSAQIGGPVDGLFLHVPSHIVTADVSAYQHTVSLEGELLHESASSDPCVAGHVRWVSRNDMTDKAIVIDLANTGAAAPLTVSFKLMPAGNLQSEIIMQSDAFVIEQAGSAVNSSFYDSVGGQSTVTNDASVLKTRSCNHFAVVLGNGAHVSYLNGKPAQAAADTGSLRSLEGVILIGPYPGKVWDVRIYERTLSQEEILELGGADCSDELLATSPLKGYPNYLCGVYGSIWWPDGTELTMETYQYYMTAGEMVKERNIFEAGMYPRDNLCDYILNDLGGGGKLDEGIRNAFVRPWSFSNPLSQSNGQHWLHENFHYYQGRLKGYLGFGGSKFFIESTASWGAAHNIPAVKDDLLGHYAMHPHLPLWTIQDSPVDDRAGWEFKGGHQYGANIFWLYLTNYMTGKSLVGDIYNDTRAASRPAEAAYDLLAAQGHDMKPIFADFAARITTFYDSNGTGNQWTSVPEKYIPGSWAFNAYGVDVSQNGDYIVAVNTDVSNPAYSDFRARVVVHDKETDERTYHNLNVAPAGETSKLRVSARSGDEFYLVVATTPDIFRGWDWYQYQFMIYPAEYDSPPPLAPTNLAVTGLDNIVALDWDDNTEPDLVGYNVYRSTSSGGPYTRIARARDVVSSEYTDDTSATGIGHYYVVTAVNTSANESDYSNEVSATPIDTIAPMAPTNLSAISGDNQVSLDWDDNTEVDVAGYNVYRSTNAGSGYSQIATGVTTSDYVDDTATNETAHYYVTTAVDIFGNESGYSNEASDSNWDSKRDRSNRIVRYTLEEGSGTIVANTGTGEAVTDATLSEAGAWAGLGLTASSSNCLDAGMGVVRATHDFGNINTNYTLAARVKLNTDLPDEKARYVIVSTENPAPGNNDSGWNFGVERRRQSGQWKNILFFDLRFRNDVYSIGDSQGRDDIVVEEGKEVFVAFVRDHGLTPPGEPEIPGNMMFYLYDPSTETLMANDSQSRQKATTFKNTRLGIGITPGTGNQEDPATQFNGLIDDVQIWNISLSEADLIKLATQGGNLSPTP